ncbi:MAG: prepilin-type N-terminal cleavage/methylation domain-containing protein [Alphaproteobacteria bacterium]|nr:prepilin-type N-terminal cleavage/methylation domain-containing protein [Alphaproteobacteria bacterium]
MKSSQKGRSMIEMLSVLAIAGILSTVGIAGYVMAMNRYRANQILDYVNRCALIAQTNSKEGYAVDDAFCGDLLTDSAPLGLDGKKFVVKNAANASTTYTVTTPVIKSDQIRAALVARATSALNGEIIDIWDLQEKIEFTFRRY